MAFGITERERLIGYSKSVDYRVVRGVNRNEIIRTPERLYTYDVDSILRWNLPCRQGTRVTPAKLTALQMVIKPISLPKQEHIITATKLSAAISGCKTVYTTALKGYIAKKWTNQ
jgi:hypothetical protein